MKLMATTSHTGLSMVTKTSIIAILISSLEIVIVIRIERVAIAIGVFTAPAIEAASQDEKKDCGSKTVD